MKKKEPEGRRLSPHDRAMIGVDPSQIVPISLPSTSDYEVIAAERARIEEAAKAQERLDGLRSDIAQIVFPFSEYCRTLALNSFLSNRSERRGGILRRNKNLYTRNFVTEAMPDYPSQEVTLDYHTEQYRGKDVLFVPDQYRQKLDPSNEANSPELVLNFSDAGNISEVVYYDPADISMSFVHPRYPHAAFYGDSNRRYDPPRTGRYFGYALNLASETPQLSILVGKQKKIKQNVKRVSYEDHVAYSKTGYESDNEFYIRANALKEMNHYPDGIDYDDLEPHVVYGYDPSLEVDVLTIRSIASGRGYYGDRVDRDIPETISSAKYKELLTTELHKIPHQKG